MAETNPISPEARRYMFKLVTEYWKYFEQGDMTFLWSVVGYAMQEDGLRGHDKHDNECKPYYRLAIKMISDRFEVFY